MKLSENAQPIYDRFVDLVNDASRLSPRDYRSLLRGFGLMAAAVVHETGPEANEGLRVHHVDAAQGLVIGLHWMHSARDQPGFAHPPDLSQVDERGRLPPSE